MSDTPITLDNLPFSVHLNPGDIDDFISAHGIKFNHWKAMRCPGGLKSKTDTRRTDDCQLGCNNGYLYTYAGDLLLVPSGNQSKISQYDQGMMTGASLSVTPPRYYLDSDTRVALLQFDRLFLPDDSIVVPMWELHEAHQTGVDRLRFPVVEVIDLIDSSGVRYTLGDFQLQDGKIVWGKNRPGEDPDTGTGRVYSVRYTYKPYWIVSNLIHEVRVSTVEDPMTGGMVTGRLPQSAIITREFLYETTDPDVTSMNNPRKAVAPSDGGFGIR